MMTGGHTHSHIRPCGGRLVRIEQNERKKRHTKLININARIIIFIQSDLVTMSKDF